MWSWREQRAAAPVLPGAVLLLALAFPAFPAVAAAAPGVPGADGATATGSAADLVVTVTITPNRPGPNTLSAVAASSRRPPPSPVTGVELRLSAGPGVRSVRLTPVAPGRYVGSDRLERAGTVTARAVVVRAAGSVTVPLSWSVGSPLPVTAPPATGSGSRAGSLLAVALPPLAGVLLLGAARRLSRRLSRQRPAALSPPSAEPSAEPPAEPALEGVR